MIVMPLLTYAQNNSNPSSEVRFKSKEDSLWFVINNDHSIAAMESYLRFYPQGAYADSVWIIYKKHQDFDEVFVDDDVVDENENSYEGITGVDVPPTFPGGDDARMKFISDHLKYPLAAKEAGIQGRVYIKFTVNENGSVSDVWVLKGIGGGCDEEAVRVISSFPAWNPGTSHGKPVKYEMNIPIFFALW